MKTLIPMLVISSLGLTACPQQPATAPTAQVRFVHAVSDVAAVDVYVAPTKGTTLPSNTAFAQNLSYKSTSPASGFKGVDLTNPPKLSVCVASGVLCPVQDASLTLNASKNQTIVIVGTASTNDDSGATPRPLEALALPNDEAASTTATNFKLRLVHAAATTSADKVDIYVTAPDADITGVLPTTSNVSYKASTPYLESAAGTYRVRVTTPSSKTAIIDSGPITLTAGKVYTAVAVTPLAGPTSGAVVLTDK